MQFIDDIKRDLKEEVPVPEDKKVIYCVLAFLLGHFGVHNFAIGNSKKGMAQLKVCVVGLLACCTGPLIAWILAILDIVNVLNKKA